MKSLQKIKFGDLYLIPSRNGLSRPGRVRGSGFKMINMGEIFQYDRINDIPMELVPMSHREVVYMCVEEGDLLFARQSLVLSGAGKVSIVTRAQDKTTFESHIIRVRLDRNKAEPLFYYYYFKSPYSGMKAIVQQCAQSGIRGRDLQKLLVNYPKLETQKGIVDIIDHYDQLLDTNRRRIQLLEKSARLLFREWFVYFRFPLRLRSGQAGHGKVHPIRKSNSNGVKIVDDAPEGWEKGSVKDIAKVKSGYAFDSKDWLDEGNPVIKIGNIIGDGTVNLDDCSYIDHNVASKAKDFVLKKGDLLIAMTGATVGKVGLLSENEKIAYLNQRVGKFIPQFEGAELILYCFFMSDTAQNHITNYAGGAAQANISASQIESIKIVVAPQDIYNQFIGLIKSTFEQILNLRNQNQKLAQARDLLLPRLMSGAIEV